MATIPKIRLDKFKTFVTSNEIIAVASAVLLTPVILGTVSAVIGRFPLLRDHFALGMVIAAFVIFILAGMMKGIVKTVLIGLAGGVLLTAIQSTTAVQSALNQLSGLTK